MAAQAIAPPEFWGVGQYAVGERRVSWELSLAETERDAASAAAHLRALGLGPGTSVLYTSLLSEAPHFWPLFMGTIAVGAELSLADATPFGAYRTAMFTRTVEYRAALGVSGAVLDGLEDMGRAPAEVFAGVPVVGARPDAVARLESAGLRPHRFALLGPALGVEAEPGEGCRVDPELWDVERVDGTLVVTSLTSRRTPFVRQETGFDGTVRRAGDLQLVDLA